MPQIVSHRRFWVVLGFLDLPWLRAAGASTKSSSSTKSPCGLTGATNFERERQSFSMAFLAFLVDFGSDGAKLAGGARERVLGLRARVFLRERVDLVPTVSPGAGANLPDEE